MANSSPPYHVIATDMDGTLLTPQHTISPFTKKTLQDVVAKYRGQVFIGLVSGRHYLDLLSISQFLQLPEYSVFIVSSNGARVHAFDLHRDNNTCAEASTVGREITPSTLHEVFSTSIPCHILRQLLLILPEEEREVNMNLYQRDTWRCTLEWPDVLQYSIMTNFRYHLFNPRELVREYEEYRNSKGLYECSSCQDGAHAAQEDADPSNPLGGVAKLFFGSDNLGRLHDLHVRIHSAFPFLSIAYTSPYCMEVMGENVSKFTGVERVLPYLRARWEKLNSREIVSTHSQETQWLVGNTCIAFGDADNDVPLLEKAAKACLMGNSSDKLKEKLMHHVQVIGSNTEDTVARFLQDIFLHT